MKDGHAERTKASAWHYLALALILLLAVLLHFYNLAQEGFANLYYAAAVRSMLTSWHNFFFASFDPGGFVTVDKPPLGLWVQTASAWLFGFQGWSLLLPQALAGVLSVALLYYLVRRSFGPAAGLIAALLLALTPISVAANRNNTMDSLLVLTSLLAAWAALLAAQRGRLRWLLVCALWVGIGFNIKMLQAYMVLPAFILLYLLAAPLTWWKRLWHLVLAAVLLAVVSLSWALVVDATPVDQRPFIGSSQNNTVMQLVLGHNGAARLGVLAGLVGLPAPGPRPPIGGPPGAGSIPNQGGPSFPGGGPQPGGAPGAVGPLNPAGPANPGSPAGPGSAPFPAPPNPGGLPGAGAAPNTPGQPVPGQLAGPQSPALPAHMPPGQGQPPPPGISPGQTPGRPGMGSETGDPGILRLFNQQLAGQISWFLPLSLLCLLAAGWQENGRRSFAHSSFSSSQQALILWGGWLIPQVIFFSYAGLFHRYYLEMMAPAVAALCGAGLVALWSDYRRGLDGSPERLAKLRAWLLPLALLLTALVETGILTRYPEWARWLLPLLLVLTFFSVLGLSILLLRNWRRPPLSTALAPADDALQAPGPGVSWPGIYSSTRLAAGLAVLGLLALLLAPAAWAATPVVYVGDVGLPYAGPELQGPARAAWSAEDNPENRRTAPTLDYVLANRDGEKFILATINARSAAPFILASGEAVMALGGFSGGDRILSAEALQSLVQAGEVRFFLLPGGPEMPPLPGAPPQGNPPQDAPPGPAPQNRPLPAPQPPNAMPGDQQSELAQWVARNCRPVPPRLWRAGPAAMGEPLQLWDCRK